MPSGRTAAADVSLNGRVAMARPALGQRSAIDVGRPVHAGAMNHTSDLNKRSRLTLLTIITLPTVMTADKMPAIAKYGLF